MIRDATGVEKMEVAKLRSLLAIGPSGISAMHCFMIRADWRTSSTRTMNRS